MMLFELSMSVFGNLRRLDWYTLHACVGPAAQQHLHMLMCVTLYPYRWIVAAHDINSCEATCAATRLEDG
jgi:hypothetical protein